MLGDFLSVRHLNSLLEKVFYRIIIHSKNDFFRNGWTKERNFFVSKFNPIENLIWIFTKVLCNTPLLCKMHFNNNSQSMHDRQTEIVK